jgi:hypothetical protein
MHVVCMGGGGMEECNRNIKEVSLLQALHTG